MRYRGGVSSRTGLRPADGQSLSPRLAALCGPSTVTLNFAARHPTPLVRKGLDLLFQAVGAPHVRDASARDLEVDGADGARLPARLYEPEGLAPQDDGLLVYLHGGGWTLGSIDSHRNTCRFIAKRARCRVLAIGYRKAPEHRFPTAFEDSRAAFRWAVAHAAELRIDPARIAIGGDSAGGNLSAAVCLNLDPGEQGPSFAWLIYPLVDADIAAYDSDRLFADGPLLSHQNASDMMHHYVPGPHDQLDPRMSVIRSDALAAMPPTYIATAGMDPLRDQAEPFADLLRNTGVAVEVRHFDNLPHGFDLLLIDPDARRATEEACGALARGLAGSRSATAVGAEPASA